MMYNEFANCIYDVYNFLPKGIIEKREKSAGWSRNSHFPGGGMTSNVLKWKKRIAWKTLISQYEMINSFDEALSLLCSFDKDNLLNFD